ncbi:MAG: DUF2807 domain-containing protein [Bacteroidales bacterium]|nr:DUF2807 domain-containing protein [Bacteroidales bacterium]
MKTNRLITMAAIAMAALTIGLTGCAKSTSKIASANITTENRNVNGFVAVEVSSALNVNINYGEECGATITADPILMPYVHTEAIDGRLMVTTKNTKGNAEATRAMRHSHSIKISITMPNLVSITTSGASNVEVGNFVCDGNFMAKASGASSLHIHSINSNGLIICDASGASDIHIAGQGESANIMASGASYISASDLSVLQSVITSLGASKVDATASHSIKIETSDASDADCYGNTADVGINTARPNFESRR